MSTPAGDARRERSSTAAPVVANAVSEKEFLEAVLELARWCGFRCYHTHRSDRSEPGFPDLVLVRPPRIIYAELKSEKGRLSPAQKEWLDALGACAGGSPWNARMLVAVWRPSDWPHIERQLAR